MRNHQTNKGLTVNAVAGSHVVILGLNITDAMRQGLRGFGIKRADKSEGESYWMSGAKVFESVEPHPAAGGQYSSLFHPFQSFQWADYSAKPAHNYVYTIVAMYGDPGALEQRVSVDVEVTTEPIVGAKHTINFNRGSPATQEYARRFQNKMPKDVGPAAYDWLSRGLIESIIAFIQRATGNGFALRGAFYEFQWPTVLNELRAAKARGVDVSVVFDDIDNATGPHTKNETAIGASKIKSITVPRTKGTLMHNKFLVLTENGVSQAVLFGSTNLTENGLFGHANCTHVTENKDIADKYLAFYEKLRTDPETSSGSSYKTWTIDQTPAPATTFVEGMAPVFSPRANLDAMDWYGELAGSAKDALFMTFAFGMNETFRDVYGKDDAVLRFGLMEKGWNGKNKEAQIAAIRKLQARTNVVVAIGNRITLNNFDQWLKELDRITNPVNVHWIHLKFMLVDPLSDEPVVVTGSANFSEASTKTNDENMLVIKGDTRVADIYLGEYMRLYSHYAFREAVQIFLQKNPDAKPEDMKQGFLIEKEDWTTSYFDPQDRSARMARRLYFAG
ncbi:MULTISPECIES: phospholipase D-like domain-containing protein [unclassified Mesorhizobium]|uniref:phospholipase D-like domain-containing protein n=1 Tax=unclassified Mesorhizobium TaxID=325217 RepID=UPI001CCAB49F|nr:MULTISPECIES: phospholipase D-like domain-containing protein [unclassified Mesorhizobium]MBZ9741733.1 phospholipase D-like domain-containing protein [Mesorhizobium sp. CO1-1-4]MBZ9803825.1 phospholipase D-like domain-containing protein [Mesorhizobium sp. ES1-6]